MKNEIERKFLVKGCFPYSNIKKVNDIVQGYLFNRGGYSIRVRQSSSNGSTLTLKCPRRGITRKEMEIEIGVTLSSFLLKLCVSKIEKSRIKLLSSLTGVFWEVDIFHNLISPLTLAEIELPHETEIFVLPDWLGEEVSYCENYYNDHLIKLVK